MYYSLDRFTEDSAVLVGDDGSIRTLSREWFAGRQEGDLFLESDGRFIFAPDATAERRAHMKARLGRILKKNK